MYSFVTPVMRLVCGAVAVILVAWPGGTMANPESVRLSRIGETYFMAGRFEDALKNFEAAAAADPSRGNGEFYCGASLNRLGRFSEALARLDKAASAGCANPEMAFERGWSLLELGRFTDAIAELRAYDEKHAGRGKTSEFTGRAYLGLKEYKKARVKYYED